MALGKMIVTFQLIWFQILGGVWGWVTMSDTQSIKSFSSDNMSVGMAVSDKLNCNQVDIIVWKR